MPAKIANLDSYAITAGIPADNFSSLIAQIFREVVAAQVSWRLLDKLFKVLTVEGRCLLHCLRQGVCSDRIAIACYEEIAITIHSDKSLATSS